MSIPASGSTQSPVILIGQQIGRQSKNGPEVFPAKARHEKCLCSIAKYSGFTWLRVFCTCNSEQVCLTRLCIYDLSQFSCHDISALGLRLPYRKE